MLISLFLFPFFLSLFLYLSLSLFLSVRFLSEINGHYPSVLNPHQNLIVLCNNKERYSKRERERERGGGREHQSVVNIYMIFFSFSSLSFSSSRKENFIFKNFVF